MNSSAILTIFVVVAAATSVHGAIIKNCGGSANIDTSLISISGCDRKNVRCRLIRGQNAKMSLPFIPATNTQTLKPVVHGILANIIPVPFSIPQDDGCIGSGISCPLRKGVIQNYVAELPVSKAYPKVRVGVKWQLKDDDNNDVVCIIFPAELTD